MKPSDIMHPEDAKAISVLKKIPLIDSICREVLEFAEENIYRGENLAMMMRVTPTCMPDLFSDMSVVVWRKRSIPTHSNGSIHSLLSPKIGLRSA